MYNIVEELEPAVSPENFFHRKLQNKWQIKSTHFKDCIIQHNWESYYMPHMHKNCQQYKDYSILQTVIDWNHLGDQTRPHRRYFNPLWVQMMSNFRGCDGGRVYFTIFHCSSASMTHSPLFSSGKSSTNFSLIIILFCISLVLWFLYQKSYFCVDVSQAASNYLIFAVECWKYAVL